MTIGIDCKDCGEQVVFWLDGEETDPTAECDECGAVYRLWVKRIVKGTVETAQVDEEIVGDDADPVQNPNKP